MIRAICVISILKFFVSDAIYQLIVTLAVISCNCAFLVFELTILPIYLSIVASLEMTCTLT